MVNRIKGTKPSPNPYEVILQCAEKMRQDPKGPFAKSIKACKTQPDVVATFQKQQTSG